MTTNSSLITTYVVYIDGGREVVTEDNVNERHVPFGAVEIKTESGEEYVLFEDEDAAGEQAAEYWRDMAEKDPQEFVAIVGEDVLIQWALGNHAGPGSESATSLEGWLEDIVAKHPEEHWASYDNDEREFECKHPDLSDYTVAYRTG